MLKRRSLRSFNSTLVYFGKRDLGPTKRVALVLRCVAIFYLLEKLPQIVPEAHRDTHMPRSNNLPISCFWVLF